MKLDLVGTTALASLLLFVGYRLRHVVPVLGRLNVPAPVIGGLLAALALLAARIAGVPTVELDTTLQRPLMIAFFTSLGFAASFRLLRIGGPHVVAFLALTSVFAVLQNVVGTLLAVSFGLHPLVGVLAGSVTLTGGPGTGLAFAPLFEQAGVTGAAPIATACAMVGIVLGGLLGAPVATVLVERRRLRPTASTPGELPDEAAPVTAAPAGAETRLYDALKSIAAVLIAMWAGFWISAAIESAGITMPPHIGGMLAAGVIRNLDDVSGWLRLPHASIETAGAVSLSVFLVMAMMSLNLFELSSLALPLLVTLAVQAALVWFACLWPLYRLMGRDYDSAVMCGGFTGVMLGTTANAVAVMRALVDRYGPAPRAFLVVPLVGGFFLDFTNALIITVSLNLLA